MTRFLIIFCALVMGLMVLFHPESEGQIMPFGFMAGTTTTTIPADTNLVLYQEFAISNECSNGFYDDSTTYDNDGTQSVGSARATWYPDGPKFDGDDYILFEDDLFETDYQGTFMAWVKILAVDANDKLFSSSKITASDRYIDFFIQYQKLRVQFRDGVNNDLIYTTNLVAVGEWHHVSISSDGSTYAFCYDGVGVPLTVAAGANAGRWFGDLNTGVNTVSIGRWKRSSETKYFDGYVDDVRLYNRTLSTNEIYEIYQEGH